LSVRSRAKPRAKKKEGTEGSTKAGKPRPTRPSGRIPGALVSARHGTGTINRDGKGFSMRELAEGGLPLGLALKWQVPVDLRRRSTIQANVAAIKKWYVASKKAEAAAPQKAQPAPRKRAPRKKET